MPQRALCTLVIHQELPTSRRTDLENDIRQSVQLIANYQDTIRTSNRPEERARARRLIQEQRELVDGYLREYH